MSCLGFKGGIGTASRRVPSGHTVGVLTLTNFGDQNRLTIDGVPVGRMLPPDAGGRGLAAAAGRLVHHGRGHRRSAGCRRLLPAGPAGWPGPGPDRLDRASRQRRDLPGPGDRAAGAARCAPARPVSPSITGRGLDPFFAAVVEATEEAVLNSLLAAPTVTGRDGNTSRGLPAATGRGSCSTEAGRIDPPPARRDATPRRRLLALMARLIVAGSDRRLSGPGTIIAATESATRQMLLRSRLRLRASVRWIAASPRRSMLAVTTRLIESVSISYPELPT